MAKKSPAPENGLSKALLNCEHSSCLALGQSNALLNPRSHLQGESYARVGADDKIAPDVVTNLAKVQYASGIIVGMRLVWNTALING